MNSSTRVVVVGGGHNGLVCAAYLARGGKDVTVLEAAEEVGGAAVTREFAPGFRVSACAHLLNLLDASVADELRLASHGLKLAHENLKTIALAEDGDHLQIDGSRVTGGGVSDSDKAALVKYRQRMHRFANLLGGLYKNQPPRLGVSHRGDLLGAAKLALDIRLLGKEEMREFLRIAGINIYDVLEESFDSPLLKGALSLDGVLGTFLGPRSNNSVFTALHRMTGELAGKQGALALPAGGMGAVTAALADAATAAGTTVRTGSAVARILVDGDRVTGVELASGERMTADTVVSNADPRRTFFDLVGARHLDAGFVRKIQHLRMRGHAAKLHLALKRLPDFTGVGSDQLGERLIIAPDPAYVERAFDHAKYREYSTAPALEITIPSVHDPGLAPAGQHVLSAIVQYAPYDLKGGWDAGKAAFTDVVVDQLSRYAPDLRRQIAHIELLTPVDIEREFRITGGHWHHGELALDQALMLRPVPGAAQYRTPLGGLFLCGAGCHPGGGVMGHAGRNAATAVLNGA